MLERASHIYSIKKTTDNKFQVMMVLSEHDTQEEAAYSMMKAIKKESSDCIKNEIEELKAAGIDAITFEDAIKDMEGEELERFLKEREERFIKKYLG